LPTGITNLLSLSFNWSASATNPISS